jgi:hypothetical protein
VAPFNKIDSDFFGAPEGERLWPGPFANLEKGFKQRSIDPRGK